MRTAGWGPRGEGRHIHTTPVGQEWVVPGAPPGTLDELLHHDVFGWRPQHAGEKGLPADVFNPAAFVDVPVEPLGVHVACGFELQRAVLRRPPVELLEVVLPMVFFGSVMKQW